MPWKMPEETLLRRALLADVAAGLIDVVVVSALDRLSRDAGHLRELLLYFDAARVRVIASGQALDRDTPGGRLQTGILAEFGEYEKEMIKDRTRTAVRAYIDSGKPWGSAALRVRQERLRRVGPPRVRGGSS
jgi:DNA invertase Pin-like site-specific DNA recombinase